MGRTYLFECSKCGYRAKVSGGPDRGFHFAVQTILCLECDELYDAVTELKIPSARFAVLARKMAQSRRDSQGGDRIKIKRPPTFQSTVNRLLPVGIKQFRWVSFDAACPLSPRHRVQEWNQPGRCPRCGLYLEQSATPFRIWD